MELLFRWFFIIIGIFFIATGFGVEIWDVMEGRGVDGRGFLGGAFIAVCCFILASMSG
jgi:hypothetical protein